jgi:hypothetical protein
LNLVEHVKMAEEFSEEVVRRESRSKEPFIQNVRERLSVERNVQFRR